MLSIYSNAHSQDAQIYLGRAQDASSRVMSQLASGLRINSAADDPSGMAISTVLDTQVRSYNQAQRNTSDGIPLLQTVDGALGQVHGSLQRMRELAVQSASGTYSDNDRASIQTEFLGLQSEINRIASSTSFGSINLLNSAQTITLQVGINKGGSNEVQVAVGAHDTAALGVNNLKVDVLNNAQAALTTLDTAISTVSQNRAALGASQNRLEFAKDTSTAMARNLSAAVGRIRDVDVAQASSAFARSQVLAQAGISMLAQANQVPSMALALLR